MGPVWDGLITYHALVKFLGGLHCNVAVLEEKVMCIFGKGKLVFGHCFDREDLRPVK